MLKLDFWDNPLVVSAFRLKYRRGFPTTVTCLWLVALLALGALLHRYQTQFPTPWARVYLVAIVGLQFLVTSIYSWSSTYSSLRAEVTQRTLDFQRIAAISPRQILLGKLLGEPANSYLLAIATVPLAAVCAALGAVSLPVLFWLYVNLVTTGLMCGCLGLIQPLEVDATKPSGGAVSGPALVGIMMMLALPGIIGNAPALARNPVAGLVFGCFTPVLSIYGVAINQPWNQQLTLWGLSIPYLLVGPIAQLGLAAVCFSSMVRRMVYPLNPPLGKWQSYALLFVLDAVAAGLLFDQPPWLDPFPALVAQFCAVHLLASLLLSVRITPWREAVLSWVWRFRGRVSWARDSLLGDRAENSLALVVYCLIGLVNLALMVWLPANLQGRPDATSTNVLVLSALPLTGTVLLILSLGLLYQWFQLVAGRQGWVAFGLLVGVLVLMPILAGTYYSEYLPHQTGRRYEQEARLCQSFSPITQYGQWINEPAGPLPVYPLMGTYGAILIFGWVGIRRRIGRQIVQVAAKQAVMGVAVPSVGGKVDG